MTRLLLLALLAALAWYVFKHLPHDGFDELPRAGVDSDEELHLLVLDCE